MPHGPCRIGDVPTLTSAYVRVRHAWQFLAGFTVVFPYKDISCFRADKGMMLSWVFNYMYVGGVLFLFMNFFYMDNFGKKGKKSKGDKKL